tara:strand:- start:371 stop:1066 length:696 start_codon:yes stop_codon:yes gene_type:complete
MALYIDDREKSNFSIMIEEKTSKMGILTERKRLEVGDYVIGDSCFEIKSSQDFLQSVLNKRIWNQIDNMDRNYQKNFVVIHGTVLEAVDKFMTHSGGGNSNYRAKSIWLKQKFMGAVGRIRLDYDVDVIWKDSEANVIDELITIIKMVPSKRAVIEPTIIKKISTEDIRVDMLCMLKGLTRAKARLLLEDFGSIMEIGENEIADILKTKGVGKVTAERLLNILNSEEKVRQ